MIVMDILVAYSDIKDREYLELQNFEVPHFINYTNNKKEIYKILSHWGAKKLPFVLVDKNKVFYSDVKGENAIIQLIKYLKNESINKETKS